MNYFIIIIINYYFIIELLLLCYKPVWPRGSHFPRTAEPLQRYPVRIVVLAASGCARPGPSSAGQAPASWRGPEVPEIFAEIWGGSADLRSELSRQNPAKFSRILGRFRRPGSQTSGRNPPKFPKNHGPNIREILGLVRGKISGKFRVGRVVFTSSRFALSSGREHLGYASRRPGEASLLCLQSSQVC